MKINLLDNKTKIHFACYKLTHYGQFLIYRKMFYQTRSKQRVGFFLIIRSLGTVFRPTLGF